MCRFSQKIPTASRGELTTELSVLFSVPLNLCVCRFVMEGHLWRQVHPVLKYASRMSGMSNCAAGACFALVVY